MTPTPGVLVKIAGKDRTLRYTNRAVCDLEDRSGRSLAELHVARASGSVKALNWLVWAGLQHEREPPTLDAVIDALDLADGMEIAEAVSEALLLALPKEKPSQGGAAATDDSGPGPSP